MTSTAQSPLSPGFRTFLWTRLLGTAANQMLMVALAWQMYDLTGRAWDLGLVGLMQFLPALLLTIPAGQLVDRVDRRGVLGASLVVQAMVAFVLTWASYSGWVGRDLIFGLCVAMGLARALQQPAQQAMIPALVPLSQLPRAFALMSTFMRIAVIGAPALGGFIYTLGPAVVYGLCLILFVVSVTAIGSVKRIPPPEAMGRVTLTTLLAGIGFIWNKKPVLGAISLDLFAVLLGGATALLPIYAKDVLDSGPWGLGLLRGASSVGALAMALFLARVPLQRHVGRRMFVAVAVYGAAIVVFGLSHNFVLSLVALAVSGGADMVSVVVRQTLVQLDTPDAMRGRVSAVNSTFIGASNELGEFRAGTAAEWIGPVGAVVVGGVGTLIVAALWYRWFPALAHRDRLMPT